MLSRKSDQPHSFNLNNQVYCQAGQAEVSQSFNYVESCGIFGILHLSRLKKHQEASSNPFCHQHFYLVVHSFVFSKKVFH